MGRQAAAGQDVADALRSLTTPGAVCWSARLQFGVPRRTTQPTKTARSGSTTSTLRTRSRSLR